MRLHKSHSPPYKHDQSVNLEFFFYKKGRYSSSWEPHLRATGRHLPYGITQCYLPPDPSERAPPNPAAMQAGTRFTYPEGMEG